LAGWLKPKFLAVHNHFNVMKPHAFTFLLHVAIGIASFVVPEAHAQLVAYWPLCGNPSDLSGDNLSGTVSDASFVPDSFGLGLSVNGNLDSMVQVPPSDLLSPTNAVSISIWFNQRSADSQYACLVYKAGRLPGSVPGFGDRSYTLWVLPGGGGLHFTSTADGQPGQTAIYTAAGLFTLNQWVHAVGIVDTTTHLMSLYVNGNLANQVAYDGNSIIAGNYPFQIGAPVEPLTGGDQTGFDGIINEVRVYNEALSSNEVAQLGCKMSFQYTQSQDIPFGEIGGYAQYCGQLLQPCSNTSVVQINMEMKCDGNNCGGLGGYVDGEVWETDLGNDWVFITNSLTRIYSMDQNYSVRRFDFASPVNLSSAHSYFVGIHAQGSGPHVLIRGDTNGFWGTGADLQSIVNGTGTSDGYYQQIWDYPANGVLYGTVTPYATTYSIALGNSVAGWIPTIEAQPTAKTYGVPPNKESGKNSLVVITHGWQPSVTAPDISQFYEMSNSIVQYLNNHSIANWQVGVYDWVPNAWVRLPDIAINNAVQEGINLGNSIANQGWTNVHLIAHSAGAQLIQTVTTIIKAHSPSTAIQCTFLDPYLGYYSAGVISYGSGARWSDRYAAHGDIENAVVAFTDTPLEYAYNVDVTYLDPNMRNSGLFTGLLGQLNCLINESSHGWPITFYENSITAAPSNYDGFGFPLSAEAGGLQNAITQYSVGNVVVTNLGAAPAGCSRSLAVVPPAPVTALDFSQVQPAGQSTTGTILANGPSLTLLTGSPAWISFIAPNTNPVNVLSFDANFTSGQGAAGLLTLYWDANVLGSVDEVIVGKGPQHYSLPFPVTATNSLHVLGFRLDPFTNIQSVVTITNVILSQVGVCQPFTLSVNTNTVNGSLVYQLTGQAGFDYGLQASTDLVNWTQIAVLENTNGAVTFYDPAVTNFTCRFYRAIAPY
jgi:hypothetical protein